VSQKTIEKILEKRQLSKIEPLAPLSIPEHLDVKTTKKVLALRRKELKDLKEARYVEAAKEIGLGSVAAIIYSSGQIVKAALEGVFDVAEGFAANPNPVSQLAVTAGGILAIDGFLVAYPGLARFLRLDKFFPFLSGHAPPPPEKPSPPTVFPPSQPPPTSTGNVPTSPPTTTPSGNWGVAFRYTGLYGPIDEPIKWYSSQILRDQAISFYTGTGQFIVIKLYDPGDAIV